MGPSRPEKRMQLFYTNNNRQAPSVGRVGATSSSPLVGLTYPNPYLFEDLISYYE